MQRFVGYTRRSTSNDVIEPKLSSMKERSDTIFVMFACTGEEPNVTLLIFLFETSQTYYHVEEVTDYHIQRVFRTTLN